MTITIYKDISASIVMNILGHILRISKNSDWKKDLYMSIPDEWYDDCDDCGD
jgi:hypothetical protein